jgi:hypothetical protein
MGIGFGTSGANSSPKPTNIARLAALACFTTVAASSLATPANASYIIDIVQSGANVDVTGSGSIDTAALYDAASGTGVAGTYAELGDLYVGSGGFTGWAGNITGPTSFGTGGYVGASSATGSFAGIADAQEIYVPENYVSGTVMSATGVFDNTTLAKLGLTAGTYVVTWGSGATADSLTVQIDPPSSPIPEPPSAPLMVVPALALIAGCQRLRKKAVLF